MNQDGKLGALAAIVVTTITLVGAIVLYALGKDAGAVALLTFAIGHASGAALDTHQPNG